MKGIAFLCFLVQTPGLEKIWLVKNALIQSDYRIFFIINICGSNSSVSLIFCMEISTKECWHVRLLLLFACPATPRFG